METPALPLSVISNRSKPASDVRRYFSELASPLRFSFVRVFDHCSIQCLDIFGNAVVDLIDDIGHGCINSGECLDIVTIN